MSGSYTVQPSDWDPCDGLFSGHSDGTADYMYAQNPERPWLDITYRWAYNTDRSAWLLSGDPIAKDYLALTTRSTRAITDDPPRPHRAVPLRSIPHVQALSGIIWYYALVPSWARYNHTQFWPGSDGHVYGAVHRVRTQPGVSFDGSTFTPTAGEPFYWLGPRYERGVAPDYLQPPQYPVTVLTAEAAPYPLAQWMLYLMHARQRRAAARNRGYTQHDRAASVPRSWYYSGELMWRSQTMPYHMIDESRASHVNAYEICVLSFGMHAYSYIEAIGPKCEAMWMDGVPNFYIGKAMGDPIAVRAVVYGLNARQATRDSDPRAFNIPLYVGDVDTTRVLGGPVMNDRVGYRITVRYAIRQIEQDGKVLLQVGRPDGWLTLTEDGTYVGPTQGTYAHEYSLGVYIGAKPEVLCLMYDPKRVCYIQRGCPDQWIRVGGQSVFLLGAQDRAGMGDYEDVDPNTTVAGYSGFLGSLDSGRLDLAGPGGTPIQPIHQRGSAWSGVYYEDGGQARFEIPVPPDAPPAQYTITRLGQSVGDIAQAAASTQACVGLPVGSVTGIAYVLSYDGMYYWDDAHDPPLVPAEPEDKVFYNLYGINGRPWTPS